MITRLLSLSGFRAWGWVAPACGVLLLAAAGLHWAASPRWQAEARDAFDRARASSQAGQPGAAAQRERGPDDALAGLPAVSGLAVRLSALLSAPGRHSLRVGDADVSYPASEVAGSVRWRVAMPVQGRYADLRLFLQAVLAADPSMSLEQLRVSRTQADSAEIQAELVWALHARTLDAKVSARLP